VELLISSVDLIFLLGRRRFQVRGHHGFPQKQMTGFFPCNLQRYGRARSVANVCTDMVRNSEHWSLDLAGGVVHILSTDYKTCSTLMPQILGKSSIC